MKTIIIALLFTICTQAQEHNIWYFGFHAGLDFNGGAPVALTDGQLSTTEGCASMADGNGNLLLYTNGETVYNKMHQVMQNGLGLAGGYSSVQSAIILRKPGSASIYYIFTTAHGAGSDGLRYSTVDMEAASGLGAVIEKNVPLHTPTTEALTATWHSNDQDIWVVSHNYGSNLFSAYLVTAAGVAANPVTSASGAVAGNDNGHYCTMRVSPNGQKLAFSIFGGFNGMNNSCRLFDFNAATGAVSNTILLSGRGIYGLEFSPSGNALYASNYDTIYQYDLLAADVVASAIQIATTTIPVEQFNFAPMAALQRAPDDKIYVARNNATIQNDHFMSVIHNPDVIGPGCGFQENAIILGSNFLNYCLLGLPNNVLSRVLRINANPGTICAGEAVMFSITASFSQLGDLTWDFGDGSTSTAHNPEHVFQAAGSYTVTLTSQSQGITRTSATTITVLPAPAITQPDDLEICDPGNQETALFDLDAQTALIIGPQNPDDYFITYHSDLAQAESATNAIGPNFANSTNPQTIYVRMEDKNTGCYAITFFDLIVIPKPIIAMPDRYGFCQDNSVLLAAPQGFASYLWSTGETTPAISVNEAGNYTLTVTQSNNGTLCENFKTVAVYVSEAPTITQVHTSDWTVNQNTILIIVSGNGNYEYSLDGIVYQDSPEFSGLPSGMYTVYVRDKNGCGSDNEEITLLMFPKFFTPNGDGIHDTWQIKHAWNEPELSVHIFDRYGKLITAFRGNSSGWDGTFNGKALPSTDYWFVVERRNGTLHKGHFSLLR